MIVADTGAVVALMSRRDRHHEALLRLYEIEPDGWVLPWAILPEVDHLLVTRAGRAASEAFLADLGEGSYFVEWGQQDDLERANELVRQYGDLELGLVDASVMAIAERLRAAAVATLDLRHFGAVELRGRPKLLPRDSC